MNTQIGYNIYTDYIEYTDYHDILIEVSEVVVINININPHEFEHFHTILSVNYHQILPKNTKTALIIIL